jgi:2-polyprenyl-3-methyl-5-hydroxy-6-metoxy-1,4-benzoquinol methylase
MMDLQHRSLQDEEMDSPTTDPQTYAACLRDLSAVNRITFTHRPVLRWLNQATANRAPGETISILDVACGHGDLLRAIRGWAAGRGLAAKLEGIDLNPRSAEVAALATPAEMAISYRTGDVFDFHPDESPDFIVSSQFAHHLADDDVARLLRWMDLHSRCGWFIADLHRHALAYYGFPVLARVAGWHRIVRNDGQISIARSFRRADWEALLAKAGLNATISWRLPFRYCVGALK